MSYNVFISVYDSVSGEHLNLIQRLIETPLQYLIILGSVLVWGWFLARKSDAQLHSLRKFSCKFQLNQSSQLG